MELNYSYECILSILIENQPSILTRIIGLLSRRGFIIESAAIGPTEYEGLSRIVIVTQGNLKVVDQLTRQLYKLFPTVKIFNLTTIPSIKRELILLKLLVNSSERRHVLEIADVFKLNVVDYTNRTITLEITGDRKKIVSVEQVLHKFGILEKTCTGVIGLPHESLISGQLYTVQQDILRRNLMNSHVLEMESKMYVKSL